MLTFQLGIALLLEVKRVGSTLLPFHWAGSLSMTVAHPSLPLSSTSLSGADFKNELFITCFCRFFNNAYYAKVGGVSTAELNRLEMKFLFSLDFRLQVTVETFRSYCSQLDKEVAGGLQIERPFQACGIKESWSSKEDSCASTIAR